jgi:hypothetical protein
MRDVEGVAVPRAHSDLAAPGVMVTDLLAGTTLADGARPPDPEAAARALAAAFRAAALDAGLAPVDPRPTHVVVAPDGTLGLLGAGVARPVDRDRARRLLDALGALAGDDADAFAAILVEAGLLDAPEAREAHGLLRDIGADLLDGPTRLDATALRDLGDRALTATGTLAGLAAAGSPRPDDLALGRMLGQLAGLLSRLEAEADWVAVARGA